MKNVKTIIYIFIFIYILKGCLSTPTASIPKTDKTPEESQTVSDEPDEKINPNLLYPDEAYEKERETKKTNALYYDTQIQSQFLAVIGYQDKVRNCVESYSSKKSTALETYDTIESIEKELKPLYETFNDWYFDNYDDNDFRGYYGTSCADYIEDMLSVLRYLKLYLEKADLAYWSKTEKALEYLDSHYPTSNDDRESYLLHSGFTWEEIDSIINQN